MIRTLSCCQFGPLSFPNPPSMSCLIVNVPLTVAVSGAGFFFFFFFFFAACAAGVGAAAKAAPGAMAAIATTAVMTASGWVRERDARHNGVAGSRCYR